MVNNCRKITLFSENELHLWHLNLLPYLERFKTHNLLTAEETARKNRYIFENHQLKFGACRSLLKLILAYYLEKEASTILIDSSPLGKPFLKGTPLFFNLSHSHDFMFVGISKSKEVGVDIEHIKQRDFLGIARHSFSELEIKAVKQASIEEQQEVFYRIWCQKEAFIKLDGRGLRYPLKDFSVLEKEGGGLIESPEKKNVPLVCYQSDPTLFAAYCMDTKVMDVKFFDNDALSTII